VTHTTIDYSKSPAPAFDAIEDIKSWLGVERFSKLTQEFASVKDCENFAAFCSIGGISGFPVKAWYELIHGQGTWEDWE